MTFYILYREDCQVDIFLISEANHACRKMLCAQLRTLYAITAGEIVNVRPLNEYEHFFEKTYCFYL